MAKLKNPAKIKDEIAPANTNPNKTAGSGRISGIAETLSHLLDDFNDCPKTFNIGRAENYVKRALEEIKKL